MARVPRSLFAVLLPALVTLLAGCSPVEQVTSAQDVVRGAVSTAQTAAAEALLSPTLALQETVQELPAPTSPPVPTTAVASAAASLIIRWEVTSPKVYERKYRWPVWPGGASGVTWGVGYDGGHQTRTTIGRDWSSHPHVTTLAGTSGVVGVPAKQLASSMREVLTPYSLAYNVFLQATLPAYTAAARRPLGPGFDRLPPNAAAALVSLGYNRGWSMSGARNTEKRALRDECVPAGDVQCIANQLRAMKRLWPDVKGLRDRRDDEARVALS
jgi:hypothetical protein